MNVVSVRGRAVPTAETKNRTAETIRAFLAWRHWRILSKPM
jgi:hypothetical protein